MIEIISGWYYTVEDNQYTLIHEYMYDVLKFGTKEKTGETKLKSEIIGYFTSLSGLLKRLTILLAKEKIDNGEIKTIEQHISALRKIKDELDNICKPF